MANPSNWTAVAYDQIAVNGDVLSAQRDVLNVICEGASAVDNPTTGQTDLTIPAGGGGGYATIDVDGTPQTQETTLALISGPGSTVTGADVSGKTQVTISSLVQDDTANPPSVFVNIPQAGDSPGITPTSGSGGQMAFGYATVGDGNSLSSEYSGQFAGLGGDVGGFCAVTCGGNDNHVDAFCGGVLGGSDAQCGGASAVVLGGDAGSVYGQRSVSLGGAGPTAFAICSIAHGNLSSANVEYCRSVASGAHAEVPGVNQFSDSMVYSGQTPGDASGETVALLLDDGSASPFMFGKAGGQTMEVIVEANDGTDDGVTFAFWKLLLRCGGLRLDQGGNGFATVYAAYQTGPTQPTGSSPSFVAVPSMCGTNATDVTLTMFTTGTLGDDSLNFLFTGGAAAVPWNITAHISMVEACPST